MKIVNVSLILLLLISLSLSSGCVEINQNSKRIGASFAGAEVVEHTYLWGDDGLFTKMYDVRIWALGKELYDEQRLSRDEFENLKGNFELIGDIIGFFI